MLGLCSAAKMLIEAVLRSSITFGLAHFSRSKDFVVDGFRDTDVQHGYMNKTATPLASLRWNSITCRAGSLDCCGSTRCVLRAASAVSEVTHGMDGGNGGPIGPRCWWPSIQDMFCYSPSSLLVTICHTG